MKQTITLSYDSRFGEYIVKKLVNRVTPQVGARLKPKQVDELVASKEAVVEIYGERK